MSHGGPASAERSKPHYRPGDHEILKAAEHGRIAEVKGYLADGVPVDTRGAYKYTALHLAGKHEPEVVKVLLEAGADVNAQDNSGFTPLQFATQHGNLESVNLMIDAGADVNRENRGGYTALLHACWHGQGKVAKRLLDAGADPFHRNHQNMTALMTVRWKTKANRFDYQGVKIAAILETRAPGTDSTLAPPNQPASLVRAPLDIFHVRWMRAAHPRSLWSACRSPAVHLPSPLQCRRQRSS
jgi:hypothetical protein